MLDPTADWFAMAASMSAWNDARGVCSAEGATAGAGGGKKLELGVPVPLLVMAVGPAGAAVDNSRNWGGQQSSWSRGEEQQTGQCRLQAVAGQAGQGEERDTHQLVKVAEQRGGLLAGPAVLVAAAVEDVAAGEGAAIGHAYVVLDLALDGAALLVAVLVEARRADGALGRRALDDCAELALGEVARRRRIEARVVRRAAVRALEAAVGVLAPGQRRDRPAASGDRQATALEDGAGAGPDDGATRVRARAGRRRAGRGRRRRDAGRRRPFAARCRLKPTVEE